MNVIFQSGPYRIIAEPDTESSFSDIFGDFETHEIERLESLIAIHGVFIFSLQFWNSAIDCGWEYEGSCGAFIGLTDYETETDHYVVEEYKKIILAETGEIR